MPARGRAQQGSQLSRPHVPPRQRAARGGVRVGAQQRWLARGSANTCGTARRCAMSAPYGSRRPNARSLAEQRTMVVPPHTVEHLLRRADDAGRGWGEGGAGGVRAPHGLQSSRIKSPLETQTLQSLASTPPAAQRRAAPAPLRAHALGLKRRLQGPRTLRPVPPSAPRITMVFTGLPRGGAPWVNAKRGCRAGARCKRVAHGRPPRAPATHTVGLPHCTTTRGSSPDANWSLSLVRAADANFATRRSRSPATRARRARRDKRSAVRLRRDGGYARRTRTRKKRVLLDAATANEPRATGSRGRIHRDGMRINARSTWPVQRRRVRARQQQQQQRQRSSSGHLPSLRRALPPCMPSAAAP